MDLEQPHSVPAAFGSSTPPCNPTSGSPASSADDSTILSKTPPAQNRKSPSSTLARNLVPSPRGVKRKSSLTQQGNSAPIGTSPDASSSGFGPPSKSSFISNPAANTAFSGPQFNNGRLIQIHIDYIRRSIIISSRVNQRQLVSELVQKRPFTKIQLIN